MTRTHRRCLGEFVGTFFLLASVVGSGIMATNLTDEPGVQLLINAVATAGVLTALILALQATSGAHFNPAVTLAGRVAGSIDTPTSLAYVASQVTGAISGVVVANIMFDFDPITFSTTDRGGLNLLVAEAVATFGLLLVIHGVVYSKRLNLVGFAVGGYIGGAYFFTSSTSFANPAVTIARMLTDTYTGIEPASVVPFIAAQLVGVGASVVVLGALFPAEVDEK